MNGTHKLRPHSLSLAAVLGLLLMTLPAPAQCTRCGPAISASPTTLTFPSRIIGTTSSGKFITVRNLSFLPTSLTVSTTLPFHSTGCTGTLLGYGQCTIKVTFAPTRVGLVSGLTTVRIANTTFYRRVTLSGTGLAASASNTVEPSNKPVASAEGNGFATRYKLVDLGKLGGPVSYGGLNGGGFQLLNDSGEVASRADLAVPDPNASYGCYDADCFQAHASLWKHGVIKDLGALPGDNNSAAGSINSRGWATGQSQSSTIDPVLGFPEYRGVLWKNGQIVDLGTLDAGTESLGIFVNDAGQVIGFSTINSDPDPLGFVGFPTHTFIWKHGQKLDIGTLGGDDTFPGSSCSHPPEGMVWGSSATSTTPNPDTGLPTLNPYLWDHGKMTDLGTLGGTFGFAQCTNSRHQVIGQSSLAATPIACIDGSLTSCHAFLWKRGQMQDLGTLGGPNSEAQWINESGVIAGSADFPRPAPDVNFHDAVIWKNGQIKDLGRINGDACSRAYGLNERGQVVGFSGDCHAALRAFVWNGSGPILDLNTLIAPGSGLQLTNAVNINDRGEILVKSDPIGVTPIDDEDLGHLVLLIPCEASDTDEQCKAQEGAMSNVTPTSTTENRNAGAVLPARPRSASEDVAIRPVWLRKQYHFSAPAPQQQ